MGLIFGVDLLSFAPLGLVLAAAGGLASGAEMSASKRISRKYPSAYLALLGWFATLITHLPISLLIGEHQQLPRVDRAWLWLLLYAASSVVAFWLSVEGFKLVDASIGSLVGVTEAVFAVLLAAVVFLQIPSWTTVLGGVLILFAATTPDLSVILRPRVTRMTRGRSYNLRTEGAVPPEASNESARVAAVKADPIR